MRREEADMRLAILAFLLAQPVLLGGSPTAVQEVSGLKLVEEEKVSGDTGALALVTEPFPSATSSQLIAPTTIQFNDQSTVVPTILSSGPVSSDTQTAAIKLQAFTHIAVSGSTHITTKTSDDIKAQDTDVLVPMEIVAIQSNGTDINSTRPIELGVNDEIIVTRSDTGAIDTSIPILPGGDGGGAEIFTSSSKKSGNSIALNKGAEVIVATANGTTTKPASSGKFWNGSEIKIIVSENGDKAVIATNGTEVKTNLYLDSDAREHQVVTTERASTKTMMVTVLNGVTENVVTYKEQGNKDSGIIAEQRVNQVTVESKAEVTETSELQTLVISLDTSSYSWTKWSAWYCNCLNSSMSRIRAIIDKKTGITLHSSDNQPSHFQRKPCNYKVCDCSRQDKQCHLTNVTCLEANPYTCVLNDIAYQEVLDSKGYWRKLKKGVQALYHKMRTFQQRITKEET